MTIIDAIQKKMDYAIDWGIQFQPGREVGTGSYNAGNGTRESAHQSLLISSDSYKVMNELLHFAKGEISDVTSEW